MKSKQTDKRCPDCAHQCFCGSSQQLEDNHAAGRNHIPWLWIRFCRIDHAQYHINCRRAGVDFRKQSNKLMGMIQAFKALLVGIWMVVESMEREIKEQTEENKNNDTTT